jgi:hypothetical protein
MIESPFRASNEIALQANFFLLPEHYRTAQAAVKLARFADLQSSACAKEKGGASPPFS